ncbi:MAG: DUF192 domain-containing protein [Desulfobulbaceae bacterium]|nr:DUF192 domain-containing protein [Desulfobulbaceae bacterium]
MTGRLFLLSTLLFTAAANTADNSLNDVFTKDVLIIEASAHACHRFDVYLALNNSQRARGLMRVRSLPPTTGMLFVYERADYLSMWMKNTIIPLDMLFARADGSISSVVRNTEPMSLRSIASIEPVNFVLELNAGITAKLFIDENSRFILETVDSDDE